MDIIIASMLLFFIVFPVIWLMIHEMNKERREIISVYFDAETRCMRALDSKSIDYVFSAMDQYKKAYYEAEEYLPSVSREVHAENMEMIKDHLAELEEEAWERKALKHLQTFADCYVAIVTGEIASFREVDQLMKLRDRCVSAWQSYFSIDLMQYKTTIYPKRYLREYMDDLYDPCMESSEALRNKLNEHIQVMRPEYKRKMRLYTLMIAYVRARDTVMRADLMKAPFENYTADEVKYCYKDLVSRNRLFEYKMGSRIFVSRSDKEKA